MGRTKKRVLLLLLGLLRLTRSTVHDNEQSSWNRLGQTSAALPFGSPHGMVTTSRQQFATEGIRKDLSATNFKAEEAMALQIDQNAIVAEGR